MEEFFKRDINNEILWKNNYNSLVKCIDKLCKHFLGDDFVIVDSVDETTACEIITDEIIERYPKTKKLW